MSLGDLAGLAGAVLQPRRSPRRSYQRGNENVARVLKCRSLDSLRSLGMTGPEGDQIGVNAIRLGRSRTSPATAAMRDSASLPATSQFSRAADRADAARAIDS